jgi:hypothetical protein
VYPTELSILQSRVGVPNCSRKVPLQGGSAGAAMYSKKDATSCKRVILRGEKKFNKWDKQFIREGVMQECNVCLNMMDARSVRSHKLRKI